MYHRNVVHYRHLNLSEIQTIKDMKIKCFLTLLDGQVSCRLVAPLQAAKGHPWVLRARFWGHEPQTDIALLERGFHIAYCDVTDLYGSPKAVKRWDAFYKQMTALGLNKKVGLEGMSRGALIVSLQLLSM